MVAASTLREKIRIHPRVQGRLLALLNEILEEYKDIWDGRTGRMKDVALKIDVGDAVPFNSKCYRMNPIILKELKEHLDGLILQGIIRVSNSEWVSPCFILRKKDDNKIRLTIDYRRLNELTRKDRDRPPRVEEVLEKIGSGRVFSKFDLNQGFYQYPLEENSKQLTAFITPFGVFEFNVMPFGVTNGPAEFQKYMRKHFQCEWCEVFIDDVVIHSSTDEEHIQHLQIFFAKLRKLGLTVKASKMVLMTDELEFLGHHVKNGVITPGHENVQKLLKQRVPQTRKQLQSFLGMTNYFRRFVENYAKKGRVLYQLLQKDVTFHWRDEHQKAYEDLIKDICALPKLFQPNWEVPFVLETDASDTAIAGVLMQDGKPVCFASRTLNPAECNYAAWEKECLAVVEYRRYYDYFLDQAEYTVLTDNSSIKHLFDKKEAKGRHARWILEFQELHKKLRYRPGPKNVVADYFTRLPPESPQVGAMVSFLQPSNEAILAAQAQDEELQFAVQELQNSRSAYLLLPFSRGPDGIYRLEGRIIVPATMQESLVRDWHNSPCLGHSGKNKLYALMKEYYFWPRMKSCVQKVVSECPVCQTLRGNPNAAPLNPEIGVEPLSTWQVDLSQMCRSTLGNQFLLVIIDVGTRFPFALPLKDQQAATLAEALLQHVFPLLGIPRVIHSDNGANFAGNLWRGVLELMGVKARYSPIYSPQGKGVVERYIQTLKNKLKAVCASPGPLHGLERWDEVLPWVLWGLRAIPGPAGVPPSELLMGVRTLVPPAVSATWQPSMPLRGRTDNQEALDYIRRRLDYVRDSATGTLGNQALNRAGSVNETRYPIFKEGDEVLFAQHETTENAALGKLYPRFRGPLVVQKKVGDHGVYLVKDGNRTIFVHARQLKPVKRPREGEEEFPPRAARWLTERYRRQRREAERKRWHRNHPEAGYNRSPHDQAQHRAQAGVPRRLLHRRGVRIRRRRH